jgi:hypothetical protein
MQKFQLLEGNLRHLKEVNTLKEKRDISVIEKNKII